MKFSFRSEGLSKAAPGRSAVVGLLWWALTALMMQSASYAQGGVPSDQFITPSPSRAIPGRVTSTPEVPTVPLQPQPAASALRPNTVPAVHKGYVSPAGFLVTTTSTLQNFQISQYLGLVEGAAVRQPTWNQDASAGMQEAVGGSLDSYAQMCEEARTQAFTTLVTRAKEMGANGVVGVHFDSESFPLDKGHFATGVVCVGTAVVVRPSK